MSLPQKLAGAVESRVGETPEVTSLWLSCQFGLKRVTERSPLSAVKGLPGLSLLFLVVSQTVIVGPQGPLAVEELSGWVWR